MKINNLFSKYLQTTDQRYELAISDFKLSAYPRITTATKCLFLEKSLLGTTSTAILLTPRMIPYLAAYNIM